MALPRAPRTVITGAGSGFGRALALEVARRGGELVLSDIDLAAVEETARLAGGRARALRVDVTSVSDV
jgi:NAD(P)-dependent dehydrogenase (short-subunit alcohol dehydrogenase family)